MCGIAGFIGTGAVKNTICALESLEYRGYDSCGVATLLDGYLSVEKDIGAISKVKDRLQKNLDSDIAIGHTRWAVFGKPNKINAHPHVSGKIALVHNGIIENYLDIKDELAKSKGMRTKSETDTEVIACLINSISGEKLYDKVRVAINRLEGSYAIAAVSSEEPDTIVVARKKSPLVVGIFDDGAVVASDIHAVLPHTSDVYILHDDDIAIVKKNYIAVFNNGANVKREPISVPWSVSHVSKGEFKTFMDKEIHEQPIAIYDTMIKNDWERVAKEIYKIFDENYISNITLTACGTSLHACMVGAMLFEGIARTRSNARLASELEASGLILTQNDLVVAISQSGETADTLQAIGYAKRNGAKVISIVNTMGSSVERESDYTIHMAAGPEISVASTKAFVSQLAVLSMMSAAIRGVTCGSFHEGQIFVNAQHGLYQCADEMDFIFKQEEEIKKIASEIFGAKSILYLGRGLNVPVAFEGALKLKEISYIHAEGFAAAEMKHGPIALIESGTPVVVIATDGPMYKKTLSNIEETRAREAKVIAIATAGNKEIHKFSDYVIFIPDVGEIFVPLMSVIPLQLLAMYVAEFVGADIDKPRNLAKSVTVE